MSLRTTFQERAVWTWNRIKTADRWGMRLSEETLTELNLLKIAISHPDQITLRKFTHAEESVFGADWEWWFVSRSGRCIGARIQAKTVNPGRRVYPKLRYTVRGGKKQSELLSEAALPDSVIPLYCLYNYWPGWFKRSIFEQLFRKKRKKLFGCALLDPNAILKQNHSLKVEAYLPHMIAWDELLAGSGDLPERVAGCCNKLRLRSDDSKQTGLDFSSDNGATIDYRSFIKPSTPRHVQAVRRGEEIQDTRDNVAGIVIVNER